MPYAKHHREEKERERSKRRYKDGKIPYRYKKKGWNYKSAQKGKVDRHKEKNPNWKGGITDVHDWLRILPEYYDWRLDVFLRDKFTCAGCNQVGGELRVHHIKKASLIMKENDLKNKEDLLKCDELWDINNGITLCVICHKKIHKEVKF